MFKLHISLIFVVNIKFPQANYHTVVPSILGMVKSLDDALFMLISVSKKFCELIL